MEPCLEGWGTKEVGLVMGLMGLVMAYFMGVSRDASCIQVLPGTPLLDCISSA